MDEDCDCEFQFIDRIAPNSAGRGCLCFTLGDGSRVGNNTAGVNEMWVWVPRFFFHRRKIAVEHVLKDVIGGRK